MKNQGEQFLKQLLKDFQIEGYEQSIKFSTGKVLTDRWLFGINQSNIKQDQIISIFDQIKLPLSCKNDFMNNLHRANQVLFGYENDNVEVTLKVYLEFWDEICEAVKNNENTGKDPCEKPAPQLMHRGYKWIKNNPENFVITDYHCYPLLSSREINKKISSIYSDIPSAPSKTASIGTLNIASIESHGHPLIYMEAMEKGNMRHSFDLNIYKANMNNNRIVKVIENLALEYDIPGKTIEPIIAKVANFPLGHISAGISRTDQDFFTIYFEIA